METSEEYNEGDKTTPQEDLTVDRQTLQEDLTAICENIGITAAYIDMLFEWNLSLEAQKAIRDMYPEIEQHVKAIDELFTKVEILTGAKDRQASNVPSIRE